MVIRPVLARTVSIFRPCPGVLLGKLLCHGIYCFLEITVFWDKNQESRDRFKVKTFFFRDPCFLETNFFRLTNVPIHQFENTAILVKLY